LTELTVSSGVVPVPCSTYTVDGEKAKSLAVIGMGAVVGAVADGGEGAAIGAAVGAGAGVVTAAVTPGKQVVISEQTLLEFRILEPLVIGSDSEPAAKSGQ
jgi:hypothetical protein